MSSFQKISHSASYWQASILLMLLLLPLLLCLVYLLQQLTIELQMEYKLEHDTNQQLTLPLNRLHWLKKDKEILVDGKHFDLKSFAVKKDSIEVRGIFDLDEDELSKKLTSLFDHKNKANFYSHLFAFLPLFNHGNSALEDYRSPVVWLKIHVHSECNENVVQQYSLVSTPPPII